VISDWSKEMRCDCVTVRKTARKTRSGWIYKIEWLVGKTDGIDRENLSLIFVFTIYFGNWIKNEPLEMGLAG
jgi:hypothetical protein